MGDAQARPARRIVFTLIAVSLPLVLLGLTEAGLRLAGVAVPAPLFIEEPNHPDYRLANPALITRYFPDPGSAPGIQIETGFFLAEKPPNGLRIVVQGGSTAAGFPYGLGASPAGMLERRLRETYPHRQVEVINTAMSAVNSYTLLDLADEIIDIEPDLVVVYAGHNEYLGLFGVGSSLSVAASPWVTRAHLAMSELRLYRLLGRLLMPDAGANGRDERRSMMARVAGNRSIALDSTDYRRGVAQFRHNMAALLGRYRRAGIPVFVGTLVSNERDQAPFASSPPLAGDLADPADLEALTGEFPGSADVRFALGRAREAAGRYAAAREAYLAAKDRDLLRFRAPEEFNAVLGGLADGEAVRLVAVQAALAAAAEYRIVGSTLMLEHLHPTLLGYFLLADAFYDAIVDSGLIGTPSFPVSEAAARAGVPVSRLDEAFGHYKVARIMADWPFVDEPFVPELPPPTDYAEELAQALYTQRIDWPRAMLQLRDYYRGREPAEHLRVSLILADAFPFLPDLQRDAGALLLGNDRAREALNYAYRAATRSPDDPSILIVLAECFARLGKKDEARQVLGRVLAVDPGNARAARALSLLEQGAGQ